jgi:hypothetical protein
MWKRALSASQLIEGLTPARPKIPRVIEAAIADLLPDGPFDLVAISCSLGQPETYRSAPWIALICKQRYGAPIILGGESMQYGALKRMLPFLEARNIVDWVGSGPGEHTLDHILLALSDSGLLRITPGLFARLDETWIENPPGDEEECLDPWFSDVDFSSYRWSPKTRMTSAADVGVLNPVLSLPMRFVRGCPSRCAFCKESTGPRLAAASPERAAKAIRRLRELHGVDRFHFLHSTLNFSREYFLALCRSLSSLAPGILWSDCVRPHCFDTELAEAARAAGAVRLVFGFESASERVLAMIGKKQRPHEVAAALRAAHGAGIWTALEVIVGFPGETQEDLKETIGFLNKNAAYLDEVWVNQFFLDVRSLMFKEPHRYGIEEVEDARYTTTDNVFDFPYPPIRFREPGCSFEEQGEKIARARELLLNSTSITDGDAEGLSSLTLLFSLGDTTDARQIAKYWLRTETSLTSRSPDRYLDDVEKST